MTRRHTLAFVLTLLGPSLNAAQPTCKPQAVQALYEKGQWAEIVHSTSGCSPAGPPDIDYYRGMALARLGRLDEAGQAIQAGQKKSPQDKRFPIELAGIDFKQKRYSEAGKNLHRALALDPEDAYTLNFLATVYFLEGNQEAALKYWNRLGKPRISSIKTNASLKVDPVLLDRAFTCAPASTLTLPEYRTTRERLEQLGIFSFYRLDLTPNPHGTSEDFNLNLAAAERKGWRGKPLEVLLPLLRGAPYETVYPEFYNLRNSALNFQSLLRWDDQKRRLSASLSAPLAGNPKYRYRITFDARNENWDVSRTFFGSDSRLENFNLEKLELGGEIKSVVNSRWNWASGLNVSYRRFRNLPAAAPSEDPVFTNGVALKFRARADYALLRIPEKRFTLTSVVSGSLGKLYARGFGNFSQVKGSLRSRWLPKTAGDDYEMTEELRTGKTFGRVPFDELFILGLERDNDLPLRGHIGTEDGKKGSAPLGRDYVLSNWEINKNVYEGGWFRLRLAPFLDTGRIYDSSDGFGSRQWLWDAGGSVKLGLLGGVSIIITYGKDLRTGRNAFYVTTARN